MKTVCIFAQTCGRFENSDLACIDAIVEGTHELKLDAVGSIGMVEFLSRFNGGHGCGG